MDTTSTIDSNNSIVIPGNTSPLQNQQPHTPQGSFELENGFEPLPRARSNTWPTQRPDGYIDGNTIISNIGIDVVKEESEDCELELQHGQLNSNGNHHNNIKKNSSRRNAWGNLSYADLITSAITSAPEHRLTLSQIYEWMVHNVSYFMDKGDSNSSAGWKNSIRHNLSLHNRFMRVQNEGTGKSSWWMINPDAKPGKSARRRAASMETSKFEKRRGRAKKKVEAFKNGMLQSDVASSPSSSVSEGIDRYADSPPVHASCFQLSPEFRPRTSSNASSISRLSPIQAVPSEPDWSYNSSYSGEQLAGNLAESLKLDSYGIYSSPPNHQQQQQQQPPPPSYYETQYQRSNSFSTPSPYGLPPTSQSTNQQQQQQRCPVVCQMNLSPTSSLSMSPSYQSEASTSPIGNQQQHQQQQQQQQQQQPQQQDQNLQYLLETHQRLQQQQQQQMQRQAQTRLINSSQPEILTGTPPVTVMGQLMGALNTNRTLLDDLNINIEGLSGEFDCNVDEVIKHELSMDGTLRCDFNFPQSLMGTSEINDTTINQNNDVTLNNQIGTVQTNTQNGGVYVNNNSTTNAPAAPSWVH